MIVVHAGHRVDAAGRATGLFPVERAGSVYRRLYLLMMELRPRLVVTAAAGGADLLMLRVAEDLFIPRLVALPLPVDDFRRRSVADQGDRWMEAFEHSMACADTVVTTDLSAYDDWWRRGNDFLHHCAMEASDGSNGRSPGPIRAVVVRNGNCSGSSGTADFVTKATQRGWPVHVVDPLDD